MTTCMQKVSTFTRIHLSGLLGWMFFLVLGAQLLPFAAAADPVIDLMVVYTPAAKTNAGGASAISALVDAAVVEANTVLANSRAAASFRLVYRGEVAGYTEVGDGTHDLAELSQGLASTNASIVAVASARTTYGADLVCMVTEGMLTNRTGVSILNDFDDADLAFSVVKRSALTNGTYAMIRELGRNLGCQYDRVFAQTDFIPQDDPYAYGYTFVGTDTVVYSTVEVVGTNLCCGLFSNPSITNDGVAAGTPTNNNVLTLSIHAPAAVSFLSSSPILFQFLSNSLTVAEDIGSVTVGVERSGPTNGTKTVQVKFVNQTATNSDYVAQTTTLTFLGGETNKPVSFSIVNDNLVEPNETFQIMLFSNVTGTLLGPKSNMTVTIVESKTGVAWSNTAVSAVEPIPAGTNWATLAVQRTGYTNLTNTVTWATVDGTANAGINYLAASGTLTFNPGDLTSNVLVQLLSDGISPGTLQFTVVLSCTNVGTYLLSTNAIVSILDSDVIFQFATNALSVSEANTNANVTVQRIGATNRSMTVQFATADGTATNGGRYQGVTQTVTFAAGDLTQVVPVPLNNDWLLNGDRTFTARLYTASDGTVGPISNCVVTIRDDDVRIGWTVTNLTMLENAAAVNFAVYRSGVTNATNLVAYTFPTGAITNDFIGRSGTLTFQPGDTNKTVSFQPRPNTTIQTNRSVVVQLSVTNLVAGVPSLMNTNLVITLLESKSAVSWNTTNPTPAKPASGTTNNLTLTIARTGNTNQTAQVSYRTVDGTAISSTSTNNFIYTNGLVTFAPGITNASVQVPLVGNGQAQGDLSFVVTMTTNNTLVVSSNLVANGTFAAGTNGWTLTGGDGYNGAITNGGNVGGAYSNGSVASADCYQDLVTVPGNTYTVSFDVLNAPDVIYSNDLKVLFGTNLLVNTPDTAGLFESKAYNVVATGAVMRLNFRGNGNPDHSGWLIDNVVVQDATLVVVTDPDTMLLNTNVDVTIQDPTVLIYFATNAVSVSETNGNAGVKLTVWCVGYTNLTNTVNYATADGTGTNGGCYRATSGTLTFSPNVSTQTVQVRLVNNVLVTGDKNFLVKLSNPSLPDLGTSSNCTVTVLDKDIEIGWVSTTLRLMEDAPATSMAVYRRGLTNGTSEVTYTFPTGAIANDFIATNGTLTFLPGVTNMSVAFAPLLNDVIQTNRSVVVTLALVASTNGVSTLGNSNLVITLVESKSGVAWNPASALVDEPAAGVTTNVMLTLVRTGNTNQTTHVIVDTVDGTAISNLFTLATLTTTNNYTATNGTVTFTPGVTNVTAWVAVVGNGIAQGTRQFNVRLSPAATNDIMINGAFDTGIGAPWQSVNGGTWDAFYLAYANINSTGNVAEFYQDLATVSGRTYTVIFDLMREGTDSSFEALFGGTSLSLNPSATTGFEVISGSALATSSVTRVNFRGFGATDGWYIDNVQVLDEVLIAGTDPLTVLLNTNDTVIVRDNDQGYQFATNALSVSETNGTVTLTALRVGKTNNQSQVVFYTQDLAPTNQTRFTATNATLTFAIGVITQTVQVAINNDALVNGSHTFQGILSNYANCNVTILDDEVEIGWTTNRVTMMEDAAATNLMVYRSGGLAGTSLVRYQFPTGSITNDIIARSGTLTFQPGDTNKFVAFQPKLNSVIQTNRSLTVQLLLTNVVAGVPVLGINSNLVITLVESKAGVVWSTTNSVVTEPARGQTNNAILTLVRTGNTNLTTAVNYTTLNGTALSNLFSILMVTNGAITNYVNTLTTTNNYTATNGTVVFAPGITNLDVLVQLVGNGVSQGDRVFTALLDNSTSTLITNNVVTNGDFEAGTNGWLFLNNDTNTSIITSNGNTAGSYFNGNTNGVVADLYQDLTTTSGHVYTVSFDVSMVQPTNSASLQVLFGGATVLAAPVATNAYTNYVSTQTATSTTTRLDFSGAGNTNGWYIDNVQVRDTTPIIGVDTNTVLVNSIDAVTVQDYDVVFQFTTNAVSVSETNLSVTLIVQRLFATNGVSSVAYSTVDMTASNTVRYQATAGTLTFTAGVVTQGVTVTLIDDTLVNNSQNFRVNLGILSVGALGTASNCVVTVRDNDVEIGWGTTNLTLLENAGINNLQVYRRGVTSGTTLVNYTFPNSGAITNDFIASSGMLTFQPGDVSKLVPFQTLPNSVIQADRLINVRLGVSPTVPGVPYLGNTNLVITLQESKSAVAWTPDSVSHTKPAAGATNWVTLTLARTGNTNQTIQVGFATTNGTANPNVFTGSVLTVTNGYTTTNGMVTFLPGDTNLTVSVAVVGNGIIEASKLFTVVLSTNNTLVASPTNDLVANGTFDVDGTSWTLVSDALSGVATNIGNPAGAYTNASSLTRDLSQPLTTITGHTYAISFDFQTNSTDCNLAVLFGDTVLGTNFQSGTFLTTNFTAVATNSSTAIIFRGSAADGFWAIDNVHVRDVSGVVIADPVTLLLNTNATVNLQDNTVSFQFADTNLSVGETNGSVALIVQRIGNTNTSETVHLQTTNLDAGAGSRYTGTNMTVTFAAGMASQIVHIAILDNALVDGDLRFQANLSNVSTGVLGTASNCVVTIQDNDIAIGWTQPSLRVLENASPTPVSLFLNRTGVTNGTSVVNFTFPTSGSITNDFIAQSGSVTFGPNQISKSVPFTPVVNPLIQTDRTVVVSLSLTNGPYGVPYLANTNLVITLAESKSAVAWRQTNIVWTEPNAGVTNSVLLSLTRTGNTNQTSQVNFTTVDGSAISNVFSWITVTNVTTNVLYALTTTNNYTGTNGTVTFAPGITNASVLVTTVGNGRPTGTTLFSVTLNVNALTQSLTNNVVANGAFDNDTNSWLLSPADAVCGWSSNYGNVAVGSYSNGAATSADFSQVLTTALGHAYTIGFYLKNASTNDDVVQVFFGDSLLLDTTQTAGHAYSFTQVATSATTRLSFSGYATNGSCWYIDDVVVQDSSAYKVDDTTVLLNTNVDITVLDSDMLFRFASTNASTSETNGTVSLTVVRDGATNTSMTVGYATLGGTASNGVRYVGVTGTVTFAAGSTTSVAQVTLIDDTLVNGDQVFRVKLINPTPPGTIGIASNCSVTVVDNDVELGWRTADVALLSNVGTTNLVVYRRGVLTGTNYVNYTFPTDSTTNYFSAANGTLTFLPNDTTQNVAFLTRSNNEIQADQIVTVQLALTNEVAAGVAYLASTNLVLTLQEYKGGLAWESTSLTEILPALGQTNTVQLNVLRTGYLNQTNLVTWTTVAGTATNVGNFIAASGTLTFYPGVAYTNVAVDILNDGLGQQSVSFKVALSNADVRTLLLNTNLDVTILSANSLFEFTASTNSVSETNRTVTLFVQRIGNRNTSGDVSYATLDGSATNGLRYTATNGTLSFAVGVVTQALTVSLINNQLIDGDQSFLVRLSNASTNDAVGHGSNCAVTVVDDDVEIGWALTSLTLPENAGTNQLMVYRTGVTNGTNLVRYTFPLTGAITSDFIAANGILTFQPGVTNLSVAFAPVLNNVLQTNRAVVATLILTNAMAGVPHLGNTNLVITLVESKAGLNWETTALTVNEPMLAAPSTNVTLVVLRSGNTNQTNTVAWATQDGTALRNSNFIAASGTLTLLPGVLSNTVSIVVTNDYTVTALKQFTVALSNLDDTAVVLLNTNATLTLSDGSSMFQFASTNVSASETNGTALLTVQRIGASDSDMKVWISTVDGTASNSARYTKTNGVLRFLPTVTSLTARVVLINNVKVDGDQYFFAKLTNAFYTASSNYVQIGSASNCQVTVLDNDVAFGWALTNLSLTEDAGTNQLMIIRTGVTNGTNKVTYAFPLTGAITNDFIARGGTLTFDPGVTNMSVAFLPRTNAVIQTNRAVVATLSVTPVSGVPYLVNTNMVITLVESRAGLAWSPTYTAVVEPVTGTTNATLTVVRTYNSTGTVAVAWTTVNGTATNNTNYFAASGTLTFMPGVLSNTVSIVVTNDHVLRDTVQFTVALSNLDNTIAGLVNTNATVYIQAAQTVCQFTTNAVSVAETNKFVTLIVTRTGSTNTPCSVTFAAMSNTADTNRFVATNGMLNFPMGMATQGVRVALIDDKQVDDPGQKFVVALFAATNATIGDASLCDVTLVECDVVVGWAVTNLTMLENAGPTNLVVYRLGVTTKTNVVSYAFPSAGSITNDFIASSGKLTFAPTETNKTVAFQPRPNNVIQTNRDVKVTLSVTPLAGMVLPALANSNLLITLLDTKAGLAWATNAVTVVSSNATNSATLLVPVTRGGNTNLTNTVAWATVAGTATAGSDYVATNGTLTFLPGDVSSNVAVEINGYDLPKGPRTFQMVLSNPDANSAVLMTNETVTVVDSDAMFQFSSTNVSVSETNAFVTLVVSRSGVTNTSVVVGFTNVAGTASNLFRYFTTNGTLRFAAGVVSNSIKVALTNNVLVDGNQTFSMKLYTVGSTGILGTASNCAVTVVDDDIEIGWAADTLSLLENAGTNLLTIYRAGVTNTTAAVAYTFPTTGAITNDFLASSGGLTFKAGETNRTVKFVTRPNLVIQTNRSLKVSLSLPKVVNKVPYLGAHSNLTITLMESKSGVAWAMTTNAWSSTNQTVAATNTVVLEPISGVTNWLTLQLVRTGNTNQYTQVSFTTTNGTALSNLVFGFLTTNIDILATTTNIGIGFTNIVVDSSVTNITPAVLAITNNYIGTNGMVLFTPGEATNKSVLVGLVGNGKAEGFCQFTVQLSTNNTLVPSTTNNVVTNGTFDAALDGWVLSQDPSDSSGFDALGGNPDGAFLNTAQSIKPADLYQDLSTIPGHTYVVRFDLWHGSYDNPPQNDNYALAVSFGGASVFSSAPSDPFGVYKTYSNATMLATSTTTRLKFRGSDDMGYFYLDNVRVQDATVVIVADPVTVLLNTNATVGIRDRDSAVQFATNLVSVSETNGFAKLVVQRAGDTNLTNTVGYVTSDGSTNYTMSRYAATNGTLTFLPGMLSKTVQVQVINNALVEGDQWFNVTLTNATGIGALSNCIVTIVNNDTTIGWAMTNLTLLENAGSNNLAICRLGLTNGTNVISYTFPTGPITNDFTARSGNLTFKPGETNKFVAFTPKMNNVIQTNRTVAVRLALVSQLGTMATYLSNSNLVITLLESKAGMAWVTNAVSCTEPVAGLSNNVTLTIQCTGNTNQTNLVAWATHDGTAQDTVNYLAAGGTLTFAPGQQTSDVTVPLINDGASAGLLKFSVALSNLDPSVSVLLNTNATVSLQDADTTFQFLSTAVSQSETNAAVQLTVRRAGNTNDPMTVDFGTVDGSATNGVRYTTTNGTLRFNAGVLTQTVRVALINTKIVDGDQSFIVALNNASMGTVGLNSNCTVTVIDNDVAIGWLVPSFSIYENASTTNLVVYRAGVTTGTNVVNYAFPSTGTITNDFIASSGALTFKAGETNLTVAFTPRPNSVIQTNRQITARLTQGTLLVAGVPYLTTSNLVINLLESKSGVSWSQTNSAFVEADPGVTNWLTLALTRRGNTNQSTQVSFNTALDPASLGSSFPATNGVVTFDPGVTNASVSVALVGDGLPLPNVKFNVHLTASSSLVNGEALPGYNLVGNSTFDGSLTNWTQVGNGANTRYNAFGLTSGCYSNSNVGSNSADFYQDLATVPGQTYAISFYVLNDNSVASNDYLQVFFGDASLLTTPDTRGIWDYKTYTQVATSDVTRLNFRGYDNDAYWAIADVVVGDPAVVVDPVTVLLNTNSLVTITNTDVKFTFMTNSITLNETNGAVKVWVKRDGATNSTITVPYATVAGTAADGVRYEGQDDVLTFNPGVLTQVVSIALYPTAEVDSNQTFNVVLGQPDFGTLGTSTCTVTVVDHSIALGWAQPTLLLTGDDIGAKLLTVTRYGNLSVTNKVTYTFPTGSITNNFAASNGTLTFAPTNAYVQSLTVAFHQKDNPSVLTDVVVNVSLALVTGFTAPAYLDNANMAITLLKSMPSLAWTTNAVSTVEPALGATNDVMLSVQRAGVLTGTTTVGWATVPASAVAGVNYVTASGTLTFAAEETRKDITVQVLGDGVATGTQQFKVKLNNLDGKSMILNSNLTVSITDIDSSFQCLTNAMSVSETNGTASIKVVRVGAADTEMTVDYTTRDGTATNGVRYTQKSGTLTFGAGVATQAVSVVISNNTLLDGNQYFYVDLSNPVGGATLSAPSNCTVTVQDDDVRVDWAVTNVTLLDDAAPTNLVVTRVGTTSLTSYVTYTFPGGAGTNDYRNAQSGTLTFLPGVTSSNVSFQPRINNLVLTNHDIVVRLSPTAGKPVAQFGISNMVIRLVKSLGGVAFATNSVAEPIGPLTNWATVVLTRSGNTDVTNIVNWATADFSAHSNVNYLAARGTLTLGPDVTTTNVLIAILDDRAVSNKAFYVVLSTNALSPATTVILQTNTLVTILNSDGTIQFSGSSNRVVESTNAVLTVARAGGETNSTVSIGYYTTNGTGQAGTDYVAANATLTFLPGVLSTTLEITVVNNSTMESNRTFTVVLTNASYGAVSGASLSNVVTIVDDDSVLSLKTNVASASGGTKLGVVGTTTVTVYRVGYTNNEVSVDYNTVGISATNGTNYTAATGTLTFAPGVTNGVITVDIINPGNVLGNRQFQLVLSAPSTNATVATAVETVTIAYRINVPALAPVPALVSKVALMAPAPMISLHISGIQPNVLGQPLITVAGSNGATFVLWATTNLMDSKSWQPVSSGTVGSLSALAVPDTTITTGQPAARFYQLRPVTP